MILRISALALVLPGLLAGRMPAVADGTTVAGVRALTQESARGQMPVRLRGVVTYFDAEMGHAFLQDETGSVFFSPGRSGEPGAVELSAGEVVIVTGFTVAGRFSPSVAGGVAADGTSPLPVRVERTGERRAPVAEPVDLREVRQTRWHDQLVRLRGTVRSVFGGDGTEEARVMLELSDRDGQIMECFVRRARIVPGEWRHREVEFSAVVAGGDNVRGRFDRVRLMVMDFDGVQPSPPLLAGAVRGVAELFAYQPQPATYAGAETRWLVRGAVSLAVPGEGFFLAGERHGLWVQSPQALTLAQGDVVRVAGYATRTARGTVLTDGIVEREAAGPAPPPLWRTLEEAAQPVAEAALAALEGRITAAADFAEGQLLYLVDESGRAFEARSPQPVAGMAQQTRVRVTGVCQTAREAESRPLLLLLRGTEDVTVLRAAPWLTDARLRWLLGALGALLALGALWLVLLRRQVARQTRQLMRGVAERARLEERERLGRDLHDSLQQQLTGLHLHLAALDDWTADDAATPPRIRQSLAAAARMLDHCREETRRSVRGLRSSSLENGGLPAALHELAATAPDLICVVIADAHPLPAFTEFHLHRCAQEAVTNALQHAAAAHIALTLRASPQSTVLTIADDGCGFQPAAPRDSTHFGLRHLRERTARLGGTLEIRSAPGTGTTLTFTIPATA